MTTRKLIKTVEQVSGMRVRVLARTSQSNYVVFLKRSTVIVPAMVCTKAGLSIIYARGALTTQARTVVDSVVREILTKDILSLEDIWIGELFGTRM